MLANTKKPGVIAESTKKSEQLDARILAEFPVRQLVAHPRGVGGAGDANIRHQASPV